jgi:fatty acid desaturase
MAETYAARDLIDTAVLRRLCVASDRAGFVQLGSHAGAIAVTGLVLHAALGTVWVVPAFLAHGVLLNCLYAGQHEMSHWTVFRTRKLNEVFGRLFGFVLFYPRTFDQIQHAAHHRHTQEWARDGELGRERYTLGSYLMWLLGPSYWWSRWTRIARLASGRVIEPYIPAARHAEVIREARWHVLGYAAIAAASLAAGSWAAVLYWLAPMLVTKAAHQLQNTIEHLGLPHGPDVLANTRSTTTNAVMRWLCWNMQYHTAHHAFPGVPFHRLPALHASLFTERGAEPPCMSYLAFQRAVIAALRRGRTEADYPDDRAWIGPAGHG